MPARKTDKKVFDKYFYYSEAVQSPDTDVLFLRKVYRELRASKKKSDPRTLREDFCGTFLLSECWTRLGSDYRAFGVDLDQEPLQYGRRRLLKASASVQDRMVALQDNVLSLSLPEQIGKVDILAAMNFSYFLFKTRESLRYYFSVARQGLAEGGILVIDCFGGSACCAPNEEAKKHPKFTYFWDQKSFDPMTSFANFAIHFQVKGQRKRCNVFTYDWRMWSLPELREILLEAGFSKTHVYWEGTNRKGGGSGVFRRKEKGEACEAWIAYVVAEI